ncbi:MAG TPA: proline racemase family protein [Gemmatimonadales bacterium]|jgi:proline racemase
MDTAAVITAVEVHAAGEPGRVIVGGIPDVRGATMFEKKQFFARHLDYLRLRMLREPRGYPALCCNVLLPPTHPDADAGFIILEQSEYPAMSGSNTICVVTVLLETGVVPAEEPVTHLTIETPAGLLPVRADVHGGKVTRVTFDNVPAFAVHLGATLDVPTLGAVQVDVAYGGMFHVIADAARFGLRLLPDEGRDIVRIGELLRQAAFEQLEAVHPENPDIRGVSIAQLSGRSATPGVDCRNAVVVSTGTVDWKRPATWGGALDRSPCGTGTCAKMAVLHARGQLAVAEEFRHEGILGTVFTGEVLAETTVGGRPAIRTSLSGQGWITGRSQFVLDGTDPFPEGFTVGDIW